MMQLRGLSIPMRPDHGHQMLDDLKENQPGLFRNRSPARTRGTERT
jgi:mannonate dehydratase